MNRTCTFLLYLFTGLALTAQAQRARPFSISDSTLFQKRTYVYRREYTLPYRLMEPLHKDAKNKYPLVVVLHGAGEKGTDNERQLSVGGNLFANLDNRLRFPAYVVFPQCPKPDNWTTFAYLKNPGEEIQMGHYDKHGSDPLRATLALIDRLVADEAIDKDRVYIMGMSMGGFGALEAVSTRPGLFAAAMPICSGGDLAACSSWAKKVPVWLFHSQDDAIVPVRLSQALVAKLKTLGANPQYTEFDNAGHACWREAFADALLLPWLFEQKKK